MKREYAKPEFEVNEFELEDILTVSIGDDPDGGDTGWYLAVILYAGRQASCLPAGFLKPL